MRSPTGGRHGRRAHRSDIHRFEKRPLVEWRTAVEFLVESTQIETASGDLHWLNKGVFISVAGRQPGGVIYETYLVG
jgi:hypothetical protein